MFDKHYRNAAVFFGGGVKIARKGGERERERGE
jgi:hypothetical protein